MKCPWQMVESKTEKEIDVYGRLVVPETKTTAFADCVEDECPFYSAGLVDGTGECRRVKYEDNN